MTLEIIRGWRDLEPELKGASVALGNFDGVHRGHQQVIAEAAKAAARLKAPRRRSYVRPSASAMPPQATDTATPAMTAPTSPKPATRRPV